MEDNNEYPWAGRKENQTRITLTVRTPDPRGNHGKEMGRRRGFHRVIEFENCNSTGYPLFLSDENKRISWVQTQLERRIICGTWGPSEDGHPTEGHRDEDLGIPTKWDDYSSELKRFISGHVHMDWAMYVSYSHLFVTLLTMSSYFYSDKEFALLREYPACRDRLAARGGDEVNHDIEMRNDSREPPQTLRVVL